MKRFFTMLLCASLFVTLSSVPASADDPVDKAPVKKESVATKADTPEPAKACCAEKKGNCDATKPCCADKKETGDATKACCAEKKACCTEKKDCCTDKKDNSATCPKTSSCTNKEAVKETKSSGKK